MNKKYEAAKIFHQMMLKYPDDFTAASKPGRDCVSYLISNNYRAVSVTIVHDVINDTLSVVNPEHGQGLNYVAGPTLREMTEWAEARIESDKVQKKIDDDAKAVNILIEFYSER